MQNKRRAIAATLFSPILGILIPSVFVALYILIFTDEGGALYQFLLATIGFGTLLGWLHMPIIGLPLLRRYVSKGYTSFWHYLQIGFLTGLPLTIFLASVIFIDNNKPYFSVFDLLPATNFLVVGIISGGVFWIIDGRHRFQNTIINS